MLEQTLRACPRLDQLALPVLWFLEHLKEQEHTEMMHSLHSQGLVLKNSYAVLSRLRTLILREPMYI